MTDERDNRLSNGSLLTNLRNTTSFDRRTFLQSVGAAGTALLFGTEAVGGSPPPSRGGPGGGQGDPGERVISWDGQRGSEYESKDCDLDEQACWKWILTPGGQPKVSGVGDLEVTFDDGEEIAAEGEQQGNGAYQFEICRIGGGTIEHAEVHVGGGGPNSLLTISDVECVPADIRYWQVDFATGLQPPEPPEYENLIIAAVGSSDGVSYNPSCSFSNDNVNVTSGDDSGMFSFDSNDEPTKVTVEFEVTSGSTDLHLAVFERPPKDFTGEENGSCPIDDSDLNVDEQELFELENGTFEGSDSLTVSLPTPEDSL